MSKGPSVGEDELRTISDGSRIKDQEYMTHSDGPEVYEPK